MRRWASGGRTGLAALLLVAGLCTVARADRIADPAEATDDASSLTVEFGLGDDSEDLAHRLARLRCDALRRAAVEAAGKTSADESEAREIFELPEPPEFYSSGIEPDQLREVSGRIVGSDANGAPDGSRADVKGVPSELSVSGWGRPSAPNVSYVGPDETPLVLARDTEGAGVLVVDGDLVVTRGLDYVGLLVVLGRLEVMETASLQVNGLPLVSGKTVVFHPGQMRVHARDAELTFIRGILRGRLPLRDLPIPQITRTNAPPPEPDCGAS